MSQDQELNDPEPVDPYLDMEPTDCPECGNDLDPDGECMDATCSESPYFEEDDEEDLPASALPSAAFGRMKVSSPPLTQMSDRPHWSWWTI